MPDYTKNINLYKINKDQDLVSSLSIDNVLNTNLDKIDTSLINQNGTVPFLSEQIGIDPTTPQGLATKNYIDNKFSRTRSSISFSGCSFTSVANTPTKMSFANGTVWADSLNEIDIPNNQIVMKTSGRKLLQINLIGGTIGEKVIIIYRNNEIYDIQPLYGRTAIYTTFFDAPWAVGETLGLGYRVPDAGQALSFFCRSLELL